jgi:hypothetical protein
LFANLFFCSLERISKNVPLVAISRRPYGTAVLILTPTQDCAALVLG